MRALNALAAEHHDLRVVENPAAKNARVGPLNVDWINQPTRLRGLEEAWAASIEKARIVTVRGVELPVQQPEVIVAAKLTGPQDELDIAGVLQSGVAIDETRLEQLVAGRPGRFEAFLAIRDALGEE